MLERREFEFGLSEESRARQEHNLSSAPAGSILIFGFAGDRGRRLPIARVKAPEMLFSLAPDAQAGPFGQGVHHDDTDARAVLPDTLPVVAAQIS
jgi:hypothetical protein